MSKRRKERMRVPLPYLPQNIMEDIFHKLSYTDMAHSKLVCKEWNSIISIPKFMGNHLIVLDYNIREKISSFYTSSYNNLVKEQSSLSSMMLPVKENPEWCSCTRILGSYNGLVAISLNNQSILWNPLTKTYSSIPISVLNDRYYIGHQLLYGLCYDGGRDEYSVVIWSNYQSPPVSPSNFDGFVSYETMKVSLCSFKDGHERTLNPKINPSNMRLFHKWLYCRDIGKVIYGLPHWVVELYDFIDPDLKTEILYFDLKDEKFKQMPRPYYDYGRDDKRLLGLATIDDENNLGCVFHDKVSSSLELWVMKEYGNSESWTNMFTIPYMNVTVNRHRSIKYIDVLGFMPNGELLLYVNGKRLWIYDFQKGNCRAIKYKNIKFDLVITYQPKLISPPKPLKRLKNRRRR
ncbi:F-box protein At3g07870-like [Silene latifolia]|uniref:F-box protein At3g07870-like n=1 Tax=Silene latifolia TaxID=37657 RepID=UPI003D781564